MRLRRFQLGDANNLYRLHQDESMTRWLLDDVALDSISVTSDFILGLNKYYKDHPGLGIWAFERSVCRFTKDELLAQGAMDSLDESSIASLLAPKWQLQGWFNLTRVPGQNEKIELGSRLHRSAWGKRIACSVGEKLLCYAFNVLKEPRLYLHCHPSNHPALYCAAYLGFNSPEPVAFLGSQALCLSASSADLDKRQACTGSVRRRAAMACVNQWASADAVISA
jgi:RimJ/RimL family protein N-acetyltransferase